MVRVESNPSRQQEMEVDWDEDLYGDINAAPNGDAVKEIPTGPARIQISPYDVLAGIGKILDMDFGIAVTDQGVRTYPQLVTIGGGSKRSTINVFRRGIPITKRRRFNELVNADAVWFLPVQRQSGQRFKGIPEAERTTLLFSAEPTQTRIYALSTRATPEQIGRIGSTTIAAGPFFSRSSVVHVSPSKVTLLDSDGKQQQVISVSDMPISAATISDPYIVIRRTDGTVTLFVGDSVARQVSEASLDGSCQSAEVFTDVSGIYRTFEASDGPNTSRSRGSRLLTDQQIKQLQEDKPAITAEAPSMEQAMNSAKGTQWLAMLTDPGVLQVGLALVRTNSRSARFPTCKSSSSLRVYPIPSQALQTTTRVSHQSSPIGSSRCSSTPLERTTLGPTSP